MSTYVYGIIASTHPAVPEHLSGVGEGPLRVLKAGDLAAVVSDAPEGLRPKRRELLAHQNVLGEVGAEGCVLPMRFGSVAPDDDAVTDVLTERAEHYKERLRALDGRVEYNVKANHVEEAVLHHVMAVNPEVRALAEANRKSNGGSYDDKIRLGEMVAGAVQGAGGRGRRRRAARPGTGGRRRERGPRVHGLARQRLLPGGARRRRELHGRRGPGSRGHAAPGGAAQRSAAAVQLRGTRPGRTGGYHGRRGGRRSGVTAWA